MDDDLLADDGTYKDDGSDDLDIDAEAALLGLSDEELDERSANDDQELEYVDEDGNPVAIGENNADLYEVANIGSNKLSNPPDEDILELDLDTELDSFNQETADLLRDESPGPATISKSYNERQRKDNLISLTNRKEQERPPLKRRESRYSPETEQDRQSKDVSFSSQSHSRGDQRESYENEEFDEESEDEGIADDHRERFKSERSNIITLTPAKRRTDIPDTLESVISVEETAKVQAFLENEQKRKMRFRGKPQGRMKGPPPCFQRQNFSGQQNQNFSSPQNQNYSAPQNQNFSASQVRQSSQFSSPVSTSTNQTTTTSAPQSRKILINPHFRGGVRLPPPAEQIPQLNETLQVSMPQSSFDSPSYISPPVQYSHQEQVHSVNVAPPPIYTAAPPTVQYKPPDYLPPPQPHMQQMSLPMWQPPDMTVQSYSNPLPVLNYGDPMSQQPPSYNSYNQNYPNVNYQNPPMSIPQTVNYNQPPPPVHLHSQSFPQPPINPVSSSISHSQYPLPSNPVAVQQMAVQSQPYQEQASVPQPQMSQHSMRNKFQQNQPRFSRPPEKRPSNMNMKHVPAKQPRMEHPQRKTNVHVNSSNIREIPLVDNLPKFRKVSANNKVVPLVEDEDEKTKELRMKIEEQKLLREQILKRKEERRRQMATQRLVELKKRQAEQNRNTVTIVPKAMNQTNQMHVAQVEQAIMKPSVKERIGLPLKKPALTTKKKIVVVRKKMPPLSAPTVGQAPVNIGQRLKVPFPSQKQNIQQTVKPTTAATQQNNLKRPSPKTNVSTGNATKPTAPSKVQTKTVVTASTPKSAPTTISKKIVLTSQGQRGKAFRPGNRPGFQQRPQFSQMQRIQRPRIPGPRGSQFPPPSHFMEHRMPFPSQGRPLNDMRMHPPHPPHFQEPLPPHFKEPRPPLLRFHPPNEPGPFNHFYPPDMPFEPPNSPPFRMRGPPGPNFRPRGMEPMYHDRFPHPQFQNQMPQMRPIFENNMQRFPRQRFHPQGRQKFHSNNAISSNQKQGNQPKTVQKTPVSSALPAQTVKQDANGSTDKNVEVKQASKVLTRKSTPEDNKDIPKTQSVSVQNLSSSTSEAQLKKLCSSVGVVEMIQLIKSERKAIIKFKQPSQALSFQKKYQRYMLDLAMIQVSLLSA